MNELFLRRMKELLKDEYDAYISLLDEKPLKGLRVNTLKTDVQTCMKDTGISMTESPFAVNGYYIREERGLGLTPGYACGLFYLQEPSASAAVTVLAPEKGMKVLDLCAAPGSKSTQIAELMQNEGLLVCNEINTSRARILAENIERNGAANCIIFNNDTDEIAAAFEGYFDAVLCDAPCSGEGMIRKEENAAVMWSLQNVELCARRQRMIIENAYRCLAGGGVLVYSTCTLNKEENEYLIASFLKDHPDMHMEDAPVSFGRHGFAEGFETEKAVRIFPMDGGEGHFIARMRKDPGVNAQQLPVMESRLPANVRDVQDSILEKPYPYYFIKANRVYGGTYPFIMPKKLHLIRHQVFLGEIVRDRFEPSHHLFSSAYTAFKNCYDMNDEECLRYLHGEQLSVSLMKGWYAMQWKGHTAGGAKCDGRALKNKYPKQYRLK
ncbi:MAG: NOL1/NOP2/sun family putative RNA methylase [Erysipelotrichaceae bacterium]|nr:NOL1/NOP2/sun family putative RNA methylase [Erysipelotrichaceae bacterium]